MVSLPDWANFNILTSHGADAKQNGLFFINLNVISRLDPRGTTLFECRQLVI